MQPTLEMAEALFKGPVIKENEFNKAVVKLLATELKRCGFDILLVAPTDKDDSLATRVQRANAAGSDIYVSIHYDAFDGKFDSYDPEGINVCILNCLVYTHVDCSLSVRQKASAISFTTV